jgi:hypothetical protein
MRKNRKVSKKMSVVAGRSVQIGAVGIMLVAMVILNILASSSCDHLNGEIRRKERMIEKLDADLCRESTRWEAMKTPEKLEAALLRHGLAMYYHKDSQIVRMKSDGRPYPGQLSVARANQRRQETMSASYRGKSDVGVGRSVTSRPRR